MTGFQGHKRSIWKYVNTRGGRREETRFGFVTSWGHRNRAFSLNMNMFDKPLVFWVPYFQTKSDVQSYPEKAKGLDIVGHPKRLGKQIPTNLLMNYSLVI